MPHFTHIPLAPPDPVFDLTTAFLKDPNPKKVNLGVGAYKTDDLKPWVLPSVRIAEERLFNAKLDKEYLPIGGDSEYTDEVIKLIFNATDASIAAIQTLGGTGALRIAADFLLRSGYETIYISDPSWANHRQIFTTAGLKVGTYPYYNPHTGGLNFTHMVEAIEAMPDRGILVLQASCHNPTGIDPNEDEWFEIIKLVERKDLFPLFDFAYQGFGVGIEEDAFPIRLFSQHLSEFGVAYSFSKNLGLYGERVGALLMHTENTEVAKKMYSQLKVQVRSSYSNPPSQGMRIAKMVLQSPDLRPLWVEEVATMRKRLHSMRSALCDSLSQKGSPLNFSPVKRQHGMFSFCGLSRAQVDRLREKFGIHMSSNARISVAGLCNKNLEYVVDAILSVLNERI